MAREKKIISLYFDLLAAVEPQCWHCPSPLFLTLVCPARPG